MLPEKHPFFAGLPPACIRELLAAGSVIDLPRGDIVYDAGAPSDALYLLCEGEVRFVVCSAAGDRFRAVGEGIAGSLFGETGILTEVARAVRVVALSDVRMFRIPAVSLRAIWDQTPPVMRKLGEAMAGHLRTTTRSLGDAADRQDRLVTLGTMVGSIAHDFRLPLTLISLNSQLVETIGSTRDPELAAVLAKHCCNIDLQVERMIGMIEEVSDFARGRVAEEYTKLSLAELFESFRFLNSPAWENSGVAVTFKADDATVEGAPRKLMRVLQNLVCNAVDALSEQAGAVVQVEGFGMGRDAVITVSDNGPGIPPHIRQNFWEPFVTSGKARGTGLGTAICRTLVESHGGSIRFETETGQGTKFVITLPRRQPKRRE